MTFDFGDGAGDEGAEAPDFSAQQPLGPCPKCGSRVFEMPQAYVCEKAVGPEKTCDFRSGRTILQRPVERAQMEKLLADGKTDLLQFVSTRTRRPFSAFLVRQPDGKIGFEFEPRAPGGKGGGARGGRSAAPLRVLGPHPKDKRPVELHAGRYGPYVKHGEVNATLPDRDAVDSLTLDQALALLAEKAGKSPSRKPKHARRSPAVAAKPSSPATDEVAESAPKKRIAKRGAATAKRAPDTTKAPVARTARVKKAATARKRTAK